MSQETLKTKKAYLDALRYELSALPSDEREDALLYYENYFDDAGLEHEAETITSLGDVKLLAQQILKDQACVPNQSWQTDFNNTKNTKSYAKNSHKSKSVNKWLVIALVVATFPIWIHLVGALFGVIVALLSLGFAGFVVALALIAVAVTGTILAASLFAVSPFTALFGFGAGLFAIAFAILAVVLGVWFFKTAVPAIFKMLQSGWAWCSSKFS